MSITGDRIRELRLRHHMTLDDVARALGVGRQAVYKYEQGTVTNIPLDNLEIMATMFETTPGYLAGWTTPEDDLVLNEKESFILDTYRSLPVSGKEYLIQQTQIAKITFGEKPADVSDAK